MNLRRAVTVSVLSSVLGTTPLVAAVEVATSVERARFLGDLSDEAATPLFGLHLRYFAREAREPWRLGVSWDVMRTDVRHDGEVFPYDDGAELQLLVFQVTPTACVRRADVTACGGVGLGTVNVNSEGNRQDYGSWSYQLDLGYGEAVRVGAMAKFIGKVEQETAAGRSEFSLAALGVSAAYELGSRQGE